MTPLVPLAMFGWWGLVLAALYTLRPRHAALFLVMAGWLFLPIASYDLPGLPDYSKAAAVSLGLFTVLLAGRRDKLRDLRWAWTDLAVAAACLSPALSAISVGTGLHDAISAFVARALFYAIPYWVGRRLLGTTEGIRDLCWALLFAGLAYVPLCLWEIRMSPNLHAWVYGYQQHEFAQTARMGGWRPQVFMPHGLALAIFMVTATFAGLGLWRLARVRRVQGLPLVVLVLLVLGTTLLSHSTGALLLLLVSLPAFFIPPGRVVVSIWTGVLTVSVFYVVIRATGLWDASGLIDFAYAHLSPERAQSFSFRLEQENMLIGHGLDRPWFGWTPWQFKDVVREDGGEASVITDSRWIIAFMAQGFFGLAAFAAIYLLPVAALLRRIARGATRSAWFPYAFVAGLVISVSWLDLLANAFESPIVLMTIGSLVSVSSMASRGGSDVSGPSPEPRRSSSRAVQPRPRVAIGPRATAPAVRPR